MRNWKTAGVKNLQKGIAWLLAAILLITMLPLAGRIISQKNQSQLPASLSEFTAHAASSPSSGDAGNNIQWKFNSSTGELTISGSGSMWDWEDPFDEANKKISPWFIFRDRIQTIIIQPGVDYIGNYAFAGCEAVTSVSMPDTVGDIMKGAFQGCRSLESVSIPGKVLSLGSYSFAYCDSLKTITIPKSTRIFDAESFYDCGKLESITVEDGNDLFKDIDGVVFTKLGGLSIYPSGKKDHVYNVPEGTGSILSGAFLCNDNIRAVSFPESTKHISSKSMQDNEKLLRIFIPEEMSYVEEQAIVLCPSFSNVYFGGTESQKAQIQILPRNESLMDAVWHYNSSPEDMLFALFEDVPKDSWFYEHVIWAAAKNITTGTSDITFSPTNPCVRAQMVTFLWRTAGEPEPASMEMKFTDVPKDAYYAKAVAWAVENNITQGTSETTFSPNGKLERGQTVTFLYRWANPGWDGAAEDPSGEPEVTNPFDDITGDEYYAKAVFWSVKNNITQGMTPTTFAPKETCNRAQIVTFLHRAVGGEPDKAA